MPAEPFVGEIMMIGTNFAPRNWAQCSGQLLSISQNTALFSLLGTTYGGDGKTTFALPNLQGRAPMHPDTIYPLGKAGGIENVTLTVENMPKHSHDLEFKLPLGEDNNSDYLTDNPVNNYSIHASKPGEELLYSSTATENMGGFMTEISLGIAGSNMPHSNMQPYIAINFVIALYGVYPSRP